jgi:glycosyltransferase involved in cell wall biosynthesis
VLDSSGLRVVHLVDAMSGGDYLWGKERVVALLMREQRASGRVDPALVTFAPGKLANDLGNEGFRVTTLSTRESHGFDHAIGSLGNYLERYPSDVVHSHGYRANIIARATRLAGRARGLRLVSTCHGWVDSGKRLKLYNALDRWTVMFSDVTTVPDPAMLPKLGPFGKRRYVLNAIPQNEETRAGAPLPRVGTFVAGTLGRVNEDKGICDLLEAAAGSSDSDVVFCIAGAGHLVPDVLAAGPNVHYAGYVAEADRYLASLDVYVQASHAEGLSLSLLEAMRAGLAIVATDVGATCQALTDGESALIVPARQPAALRDAIRSLRDDPELRARLGRAARVRFERDFHIRGQHESYLALYQVGERHG